MVQNKTWELKTTIENMDNKKIFYMQTIVSKKLKVTGNVLAEIRNIIVLNIGTLLT